MDERWRMETEGTFLQVAEKRRELREAFVSTAEELSEWRSPPRQRSSTQTQTDPAGKEEQGKKGAET